MRSIALALILAGCATVGAQVSPWDLPANWQKFSTMLSDVRNTGSAPGEEACAGAPEDSMFIGAYLVQGDIQANLYSLTTADGSSRWLIVTFGKDDKPLKLYKGTAAAGDNDVLTLVRIEAYDPARHQGACEDWLVPKEA